VIARSASARSSGQLRNTATVGATGDRVRARPVRLDRLDRLR